MIFGNERQQKDFSFLEEKIQKCFAFAQQNDLCKLEAGTHEIDGDRFFVNICEYETTTAENRFWEAHRQYLDIHLMLTGTERIDLCFIENMEQGTFEPDKDFLPLEGEANGHVILTPGDFLICYPHDGHRTAVQVEKPCKLRKAIFKVLIED